MVRYLAPLSVLYVLACSSSDDPGTSSGTTGGGTLTCATDGDCAPLTHDCVEGVCTNGMCEGQFVPEGSSCGDTSDSVCDAPDTCDAAGTCQENVVADGTACQGGDLCVEAQTCTSGVCSGGSGLDCSASTLGCTIGICDAVNGGCTTETQTMCINGDDCCPSGCTDANDSDCCGLERFVLAEVSLGGGYIAIRNDAACAQTTYGLTLFVENGQQLTYGLPTTPTIGPGQVAVFSETMGSPAGSFFIGDTFNLSGQSGGAVRLCVGQCNNSWSNVIDYFQWEGDQPGVLLSSPNVTFIGGPVMGIGSANDDTDAFLRATVTGHHPSFFTSDWTVGPKTY